MKKTFIALLALGTISYGIHAANSMDGTLPEWFDSIEGIQQVTLNVPDTKQQVRVYWDKQMEYSSAKDIKEASQAPIAPGTSPSAAFSRTLTAEEFDALSAKVRSKEFFALSECDQQKPNNFSILAEYRTPTARTGVMKCCTKDAACSPVLEELKTSMFKYPEKNP